MTISFRFQLAYSATLAVIEEITCVAMPNSAWRLVMSAVGDPSKVGVGGPDLAVDILVNQQPHRPVQPRLGAGGDEVRAQRGVAENQQRRGVEFDAGISRQLPLVDRKEVGDALGFDVGDQTFDGFVHRIGAFRRNESVGADLALCLIGSERRHTGKGDHGRGSGRQKQGGEAV